MEKWKTEAETELKNVMFLLCDVKFEPGEFRHVQKYHFFRDPHALWRIMCVLVPRTLV